MAHKNFQELEQKNMTSKYLEYTLTLEDVSEGKVSQELFDAWVEERRDAPKPAHASIVDIYLYRKFGNKCQ
jgi:hypothetical protein